MLKAPMRVSALAIIALLAISTTSLTAQTAGGSDLDQLRHVLKGSFDTELVNDGHELLLDGDANRIHVTKRNDRFMNMAATVGSLASIRGSERDALNRTIYFMNTALPLGTFRIDGEQLLIEHHVNAEWMTIGSIAGVIRTFGDEVQRSRARIFG